MREMPAKAAVCSTGPFHPTCSAGGWGWGLTCPTVVELQGTLHAEGLPTAATAIAVLTIHLLKGAHCQLGRLHEFIIGSPLACAVLVISRGSCTTVFLPCSSRTILAVQLPKKVNPTLR